MAHVVATVDVTSDADRSLNAIRAIVRALRVNTREIERTSGMSLAQLFVLQQLAQQPARSLNELATRTATHQSSVSVVVQRLVSRGLVSRAPSSDDKRRVEIALTPTGRKVLESAPVTIQAQLLQGLARMTDDDRATLAALLETWLGLAGIDLTRPPMIGEE
jgi:DNA-binding MarR family transcriptional regulator